MSMRYTERLRMEAIAQWRSCYIDYEHLKIIVKLIRDTVRERLQLQDLINFGAHLQARTQKTISIKNIDQESPKMGSIKSNHEYFQKASNDAHQQFMESWNKNVQVYGDFVKWKYKQIETNFHACWKANFMIQQQDTKIKRKLIKYVQYIFVESLYLTRMIQSNIQTQRRILARHKLYSTAVFATPESTIQKFVSMDQIHILRRQIQRFYFRVSNKPKQQNRYKLRKLAEQEHVNAKESLVIGLLIGALITVIVFISVILARANVTLQSNTVFNKDFTLWRGIAIFIFYIWVLGADFSYFQKYKVSLRIILRNNFPEYTISSDLFKIAGVFSIIFIIVFTIYSLQIAGILEISGIAPQWLPLFVWGPFLLFLFNPFPILYPYGRLFFFKKILYAISSVFFIVDFPKVWVTAQAISLLNVFQDFFYAICFYTHLQFPYDSTVNVCKTPAINARFVYTLVIYSIRIIQCIKVGCGQGSGLKKSQFLNSIKFSLSMLTAILAYVWKEASNPYVFPAWLTFAIISTLASFLWDYKIGWDFDFTNKKNRFLRDQLVFPRKNYYVWLVINFFFRFAWTLNISPNVVREFMGGSPQIITMSFAFVELIRRGFWNLVRIEVDQIRNNNALQALSKEKQKKQKQIYKFIEENKSRINMESMQSLVDTEKIMMEVQDKQSQSLGKQKKKLMEKITQLKNLIEQERKVSQQKQKQIKAKIEILLKQIY